MHCRLLYQLSFKKKASSFAAYDLVKPAKIVFGENYLTGRHEFHIRDVKTILYADEQRAHHDILLSPPEQLSGRGMHKIH